MSEHRVFKIGVNMVDSIWGVDIKLKEGEKVIIDSAEVVGTVVGVAVDKLGEEPIYYVKYPWGSVYVQERDGYANNRAWFYGDELRNINTGAYVG